MGRIFCYIFTWRTGEIDDFHWRSIFCWIITGTSTCIPTWISNPGCVLPGTKLEASLWLWFFPDSDSCGCSCCLFTDFFEVTCVGAGITCVFTSGDIFTFNMNSVMYFRTIEFLTLEFLHTWLIPSYWGSWIATVFDASASKPFTLGMYGD